MNLVQGIVVALLKRGMGINWRDVDIVVHRINIVNNECSGLFITIAPIDRLHFDIEAFAAKQIHDIEKHVRGLAIGQPRLHHEVYERRW